MTAELLAAHMKTLDAIQLASVLATGADTVVVTHDAQLDTAARALGFSTLDPVGG